MIASAVKMRQIVIVGKEKLMTDGGKEGFRNLPGGATTLLLMKFELLP